MPLHDRLAAPRHMPPQLNSPCLDRHAEPKLTITDRNLPRLDQIGERGIAAPIFILLRSERLYRNDEPFLTSRILPSPP